MCFALLAIHQHPLYPFVLAANRDEYHQRPALPLHVWEDQPSIIGGRDVESTGSWLALNQHNARLALVTNYRSGLPQIGERSRGVLVRDMVASTETLASSLQHLTNTQHHYAGFNLITGQLPDQLYYVSNQQESKAQPLSAGIHALSNAFLNTPWPKVQRGKQRFTQLLQTASTVSVEDLFALLADTTPATDADLPDTGIGLEKERWLSPIFIQGEQYGTRCSRVILMDTAGQISVHERTYTLGQPTQDVLVPFTPLWQT